MKCDKCKSPPVGEVACPECGKAYRRCASHDGEQGARRSLHSHRALYHPKTSDGRKL